MDRVISILASAIVDMAAFRRVWDRIKPIPWTTTDKFSEHNPKIGPLTDLHTLWHNSYFSSTKRSSKLPAILKIIDVWRDVTLVVISRPIFTLETPPPSWMHPISVDQTAFLENYLAVSTWILNEFSIECQEKKNQPLSFSGVWFGGQAIQISGCHDLLAAGAVENELSSLDSFL